MLRSRAGGTAIRGRPARSGAPGANRALGPHKGTEATGEFAFDIPADTAKNIEVQCRPGLFEYDEAIWAGPAGAAGAGT